MIDDSIISSPSKSNISIRETRLKRKNKRKKGEQFVFSNGDHEHNNAGLRSLINEFYKDSDDESTEIDTEAKNPKCLTTKTSAIISNFKPFELEKSLAMADRILAQEIKQNKATILPDTQGFITCTNLKATSEEKKQNSFIITESELISCCHQAEKILENGIPKEQHNVKLVEHGRAPDDSDMVLVNSILRDFSQSPLRKGQIIENISLQYTPEFRLRSRPVKNYSRKFLNSTKANLNQRFDEHVTRDSSEYSDDHRSCSSLSIQDDVTMCENFDSPSVIANTSNTRRLCGNLLNLTDYYTQNQSQQSSSDEQHIQETNDFGLSPNSQENVSVLQNITYLLNDILGLRSIAPNIIRYDSYDSLDDFGGFSSKKYVMDDDDNEQAKINRNLTTIHDLNSCDNRLKDDWNEDDCHDIFACINTENVLLQHNIQTKNNKMLNVEHSMPKTANRDEYLRVPEISIENMDPSNFTGFKTASSKPIKVSKEAHIIAAKILSKLPEIPEFEEKTPPNNCDKQTTNEDTSILENPEDYEWNDDCDLFLNFQTPIGLKENPETKIWQQSQLKDPRQEQDGPSTSKTATLGFRTAGGKNVHISNTAQKNVQKLLKEFACSLENDYNYEEELREMKCKVYAKTHNLLTEKSSLSDIKEHNTDLEFQMAKGKNIIISVTDQQNVKNPINEFYLESQQNYKENLKVMKQKINSMNIEIKKLTPGYKKSPNENADSTKLAQEESQTLQLYISSNNQFDINAEFQTANSKDIETFAKTQKSVQNLLEEFPKNTKENYLNDFISTNNNINKSNDNHKLVDKYTNEYINKRFSETNKETHTKQEHLLLQMPRDEGNPLNMNVGFQTANGKNVFISAKVKHTVEKLWQEFETISDIPNYENDIKELKTKIETKTKDLELKSGQEDNESESMVLTECPTIQKVHNTINSKRKTSIDNSDLESPNRTPPVKIFKNCLQTSKSSFAEQSLKSPLSSAAHPLILRKNLLSLTKKRKSKINSLAVPNEEIHKTTDEICNLNVDTATPIKSSISIKAVEHTPSTPNLKEFFSNAPLTSTPQITKPNKSLQTIEDSDLKPITWNNNNDDSISSKSANNSTRTTKLSETSSLNITLNSSNPTVKERIDRLKMYGKAPPVSRILNKTNYNCRPSGLRRTRSMIKEAEK